MATGMVWRIGHKGQRRMEQGRRDHHDGVGDDAGRRDEPDHVPIKRQSGTGHHAQVDHDQGTRRAVGREHQE